MKLAFIVSAHVTNDLHESLLRNCILSIARFHPEADIVLCDDGSDPARLEKYVEYVSQWIKNPFPKSGEYGCIYVAAYLPLEDVDYIIYVHDSTVMRRPFSEKEITSVGLFMPMWNTESQAIFADPCEPLISTLILPNLVNTFDYEKWIKAAYSPSRTVFFGCMGIGTQEGFRRIWDAGLIYASPVMNTRANRCRFERLMCCAALVAEVTPWSYKPVKSVLGNIFHQPNAFKTCTLSEITRWDDKRVSSRQPPLTKMWVGR